MVKNLLAVLCALSIMTVCLPSALAEDIFFEYESLPQGGARGIIGSEIIMEENAGTFKTYSLASNATLYDTLEDGIRQHKTEIDISSFGYSNTDENKNCR